MAASQPSDSCAFDKLFSRNLPYILEKIFFYLDYESFKTCSDVNTTWKNLLTSELYVKKARSEFKREIKGDKEKLVNASESGRVEDVRNLLSLGIVDVNCSGSFDRTPLGQAAINGRDGVIKLLLSKGADPNITDEHGNNPLHGAAQEGHKTAVELLIEAGADPKKKDPEGQAPLHIAASNCRHEVIRALIEGGADPNALGAFGWNPLHTATHCYTAMEDPEKSEEVTKALLEGGAEPNKASRPDGRMPLQYLPSLEITGMSIDVFFI